MSIEITSEMIKKLTHESAEIRLRTLEQVNSKIRRAFTLKSTLDFKPEKLCRQLIRWFGHSPLLLPQMVLQLMLDVLRSSYGKRAIERLGVDRFIREIGKVHALLNASVVEEKLMAEIQKTLKEHRSKYDDIASQLETLSLAESEIITPRDSKAVVDNPCKETYQIAFSEDLDENEDINKLPTELTIFGEIAQQEDFEVAWSKATAVDINTMKMLADTLSNKSVRNDELQYTLHHLQITMQDFPAEFMLQAPNIYIKLLRLYDKATVTDFPLKDLIETSLAYLNCLEERLKMRWKGLSLSAKQVELNASDTLPKTQLKAEKALELLLKYCLIHLSSYLLDIDNENFYFLKVIAKILEIYRFQHFCINEIYIKQLFKISNQLKKCCDGEEFIVIYRLKYLLTIFLLQDMSALELSDTVSSNSLKTTMSSSVMLLSPLLSDYTLRENYPRRYKRLKESLLALDPKLEAKLKQLEQYEKSFEVAISLLLNPEKFDSSEILKNGLDICACLEKLTSKKLIELLLKAVVKCIPLYEQNNPLRTQAEDLLLKLLQLQDEKLSTFCYETISKILKKHFACLMNGETYCAGIPNSKLLKIQIIGVPLSTTIISQIIHTNYEHENVKIKKDCEDMLVMLLQSRVLLDNNWDGLLEIMYPLLPLLQCASVDSRRLREVLLKLYNPDERNLPFLHLLQGNVLFLFHPSEQVRAEALTRIFYLLNTYSNSTDYLPNLNEICDLIPSDICVQEVPREFALIFPNSATACDSHTLENLLRLLQTENIEPLIRKTTLMQINVVCQNWKTLCNFCSEEFYYPILLSLDQSMQKEPSADYPDAVMPVVSILSKVLMCDSNTRQELAITEEFLVLLLRALFLYHNDIQVRQDVSICLFELIFCQYIVVLPGQSIEVPNILANLKLPLKCEFKKCSNGYKDIVKSIEIFPDESVEGLFVRQSIASISCGSESNINNDYLDFQKDQDFCKELWLRKSDWRLMKATRPIQNFQRFLRAAFNATEQKTLIKAASSIKLQLMLCKFEPVELNRSIQNDLLNLLSKFLPATPGNEGDFQLFEHMVELCIQCIRFPLPVVATGFFKILEQDFHHACITLLRHSDIPGRLYYKISCLFVHVFSDFDNPPTSEILKSNNPINIIHNNLFEFVVQLNRIFLKQRNLLRVRCLMSIMELLSRHFLNMTDKELEQYSIFFLTLSIQVQSSTHTGAQIHRDCLRLINQLCLQMEHPFPVFKFNKKALKYLSGLCGHADAQVRALAWTLLSQTVKLREDNDFSGIEYLQNELSYLPGGILACSLSTLLDSTEIVMVRQMAGHFFIDLLSERTSLDDICLLLQQHVFFHTASEALNFCCLTAEFENKTLASKSSTANICTSEIVACFCRICIKLVQLKPEFLHELCEKSLMFKFYELQKLPPVWNNPPYYAMCTDICTLYTLCQDTKFDFLQQTLCRDKVWLMKLYHLLNLPNAEDEMLISVMELILIVGGDDFAYKQLCALIEKDPEFIFRIFARAFDIQKYLNTEFQRCALSVLSMLLVYSQTKSSYEQNFISILESPMDLDKLKVINSNTFLKRWDSAKSMESDKENEKSGKHNVKQSTSTKNTRKTFSRGVNGIESTPAIVTNYMQREASTLSGNGNTKRTQEETGSNNKNLQKGSESNRNIKFLQTEPSSSSNEKQSHESGSTTNLYSAENSTEISTATLVAIDLQRLFLHLSSTESCKFSSPPNNLKLRVSECLAMLLKHSELAQSAAENAQLFSKIVKIFQNFFAECSTPCSTFVRRFGEYRVNAILKNFLLLFHILLYWFSSQSAMLTDELLAAEFTKILSRVWPWLNHSAELKDIVLRVCAYLSEHSLVVCQQFSAHSATNPDSILQLVNNIAIFETKRVKSVSSSDLTIVTSALRIVINCCACAEGRVSLIKMHTLDIFDSLDPLNKKLQKIKSETLTAWLQLWELFSRYEEGQQVRHLSTLCGLISRSPNCSPIRLLSLKILRNMSFLTSNRTALLTNREFTETVDAILSQKIVTHVKPDNTYNSCEEYFIVAVAIWKLITGGIKYVAMVRGTKLAKKLKRLKELLEAIKEEDPDRLSKMTFACELLSVTDVIFKIFESH